MNKIQVRIKLENWAKNECPHCQLYKIMPDSCFLTQKGAAFVTNYINTIREDRDSLVRRYLTIEGRYLTIVREGRCTKRERYEQPRN